MPCPSIHRLRWNPCALLLGWSPAALLLVPTLAAPPADPGPIPVFTSSTVATRESSPVPPTPSSAPRPGPASPSPSESPTPAEVPDNPASSEAPEPSGEGVDAAPSKAEQEAATVYADLLARAREGDRTVNFAALRRAWSETLEFATNGTPDPALVERMIRLAGAEEYRNLQRLADQILEVHFLSSDAHAGAMLAAHRLDQKPRAAFHQWVLRGIHESICVGTEGRTTDSPCLVIEINEEYFYIRQMGLELERQSLVRCSGGRPCDVMHVHNPATGERYAIHFDLSAIWRARERALGLPPETPPPDAR